MLRENALNSLVYYEKRVSCCRSKFPDSTTPYSRSISNLRAWYSTDLTLHIEITWSELELSSWRRMKVRTAPSSDLDRLELATYL